MTDNPFAGWVDVHLERDRFTVQPGKTVVLPVDLTNQGNVVDHLEFSLEGILPEWLGAPLPIVMLPPGERRQVSLVIQPPSFPQVRAGVYSLLLRVASLRLPARFVEIDLSLVVAAVHSPGPIAAFLAQAEFQARPGEEVSFPLVLANWGPQPDQFTVSVEGIPERWFKALPSRASLQPGQEAEITLVLSPPLHAESLAGPHPFTLVITSGEGASLPVHLPCQLTLAPFYAYRLDLLTPYVAPGERGILQVQNLGNSPDIYTLRFTGRRDALEFHIVSPTAVPVGAYRNTVGEPHLDPWGIATPDGRHRIKGDEAGAYKGLLLHIPAGEKLAIEFIPVARKPPPWQEQQVSFTVEADSARLERQKQEGVAAVPPIAYPWLVRMALGLFLIAFAASFLVFGTLMRDAQVGLSRLTHTPTDTVPVILWTPTATATGTITPLIPTGTSTETPTGTLTPLTPTSTYTGTPPTPTPTATLTLTPTSTPVTPTATPPSLTPVVTIPVFPIQNMGRLAMESNLGGEPQIFVFDTSTRIFNLLHGSAGVDTHPSWSPDGRRLAFATNREGQFEIYILNLENGVVYNLTNNLADDRDPVWSPDGLKIAYTSDRDDNLEIYVANLSTQESTNLTKHPANDSQPDWFIDQRIAFTSDRTGNQEIHMMNSDGSGQFNFSNHPANDTHPTGARDGSAIAFVSDRDRNLEIYVMNLDGTNQTNLTKSPAADDTPVWSPDSQWIAFATDRNANWDIYVMKRDGTQPYNLTSLPSSERYPAWVGNP